MLEMVMIRDAIEVMMMMITNGPKENPRWKGIDPEAKRIETMTGHNDEATGTDREVERPSPCGVSPTRKTTFRTRETNNYWTKMENR